jgi:hypothetical protein
MKGRDRGHQKDGPKRRRKTRKDWGEGQFSQHGSFSHNKNAAARSPRRCLRDRPLDRSWYSIGGGAPYRLGGLHQTAEQAYHEHLCEMYDELEELMFMSSAKDDNLRNEDFLFTGDIVYSAGPYDRPSRSAHWDDTSLVYDEYNYYEDYDEYDEDDSWNYDVAEYDEDLFWRRYTRQDEIDHCWFEAEQVLASAEEEIWAYKESLEEPLEMTFGEYFDQIRATWRDRDHPLYGMHSREMYKDLGIKLPK